MSKNSVEWFFVTLVLVVTTMLTALSQEPVSEAGRALWPDGIAYEALASQCGTEPMHAEAPFVYRIGVPCIAALVGGERLQALRNVNAVLFAAAVGCFLLYLRRHIARPWLRMVLVASYAVAFHAPLRFVWWAPAQSIDSGFHLVTVLSLLALEARAERAAKLLVPIVFFGTLFREVALVVPIALFYRELCGSSVYRAARLALPSAAAAMVAAGLVRLVATPTNHWGGLGSAVHWLYQKGPLEYLHAVFIAFGPALAVLVATHRSTLWFLQQRRDLLALCVLFGALAWAGGTDTWRFLYWAAPIVLMLVGRAIEAMRPSTIVLPLALTCALQLVSERVFWSTPDAVETRARALPLLTPVGETWSTAIIASTPDRRMGAIAVAEYLGVTLLLGFWMRWSWSKRRWTSKKALPW